MLQRVTSARVEVDGEVVGAIDRPGLLALVGVTHDDGPEQVERMARKIAELRILRDEAEPHRRRGARPRRQPVHAPRRHPQGSPSRRGARPHRGRWPSRSSPTSWRRCAARGIEVEQGRFGAMMQVSLVNDGPFTLVVDA